MPITAVTRTTDDGILMEMYPERVIQSLINMNAPFLSRLKRRQRGLDEGRKFHFPIETQLDEAGGMRAEMDDTGEPDSGGDTTASYTFNTYQKPVRLSGEAIETGGAIIPLLRRRAEKAMKSTKLDAEIGSILPGSGKRADITVAGSAGDLTVTVDTGQYLRVGMRIDIATATGVITNGVEDATISAIGAPASDNSVVITFSPGLNGAITTSYDVFRTNEYNKNIFGLLDIVSSSNPSSGNYGNIDRTAAAFSDWQALTLAAGNDSFSSEILAAAHTDISINGPGTLPTVVWAHPYTVNDLITQAKRDVRFGAKLQDFEIWGSGVTFRGMDVIPWRFCPYGTAFMLSEQYFQVVHPKGKPEFRWVEDVFDKKGGRWMKTAGKWAYEGLLVGRRQIVCNAPNANCLITGLANSPTGTV